MAVLLDVCIGEITARAFNIPADAPEADGTLAWHSTTLVLVTIESDGCVGIGYTYAAAAAASVIRQILAPVIKGRHPFDVAGCWQALTAAVRNNGDTGLCRMAIAAVDSALWDLKARLLDLPLARLLGMARDAVPCYGSGGFTSYSIDRLQRHMRNWVYEGFTMVKMKIGSNPDDDPRRMAAAKEAMGDKAQLFVDANEAYDTAQALRIAALFPTLGITWFEQPISHLNLAGMRHLRNRVPAGIEITTGEYIFEADHGRRILESGAVDVLMADATRCGITGFMQLAALCEAHGIPISSHCAPCLHLHLCCSVPCIRHMEFFYDHARIENMFFSGAAITHNGIMRPDLSRPGMGLIVDDSVANSFEIF